MDAKDEPLSPLAIWILRAHDEVHRRRLADTALAASLALAACTAVTTVPYHHPVPAPMAAPAVDAFTAPVSYPSHGWGHRDGFKARLLLELARRGLGFARRFGGESPTLQAKVNPPSGGTP